MRASTNRYISITLVVPDMPELSLTCIEQHSEDNIEDLVDHQQTDDDNEEVGDEEDDGEEEAEEEKRPCDSIAWTNIKINPLLLALSGLRDGEVDGDDALDIEIDDHYVERVKLLRTISVELAMSQRQELQKLWRGMYATWPPVEYAIISFPKRHSCIRLRSKYGFTLGDADKFIEIPVKGPGVLGYNTLQASCGHSLPRLSLLHRRAYTSAYASMSKIEQRDSMQWLYGRGAWRKSWLPIR